ncbi:MAG TPA: hypothetical protein VME22_02745 [Solirubrobacteraceae bacterium]|nr:hypothetical protein [Solirubrobacteraceae bacterium]
MTGRQMQRNEGNPDAQAEVPDSQIEWGQETSWFNYKTGKWESTTVTITTNLEAEAQRALEVGVNEHNLAIAAHERASDALRKAVEAGVPVLLLAHATGIPHDTLLQRLEM